MSSRGQTERTSDEVKVTLDNKTSGTKLQGKSDDVEMTSQGQTESPPDDVKVTVDNITFGPKLQRKPDDSDVNEFIRKNFVKRECIRPQQEATQNNNEFSECGYSTKIHSSEVPENKPETSTKPVQTNAYGKLDCVDDEEEDCDWTNIRYVRLDSETDVKKILELFRNYWKMDKPDVIISVVSDSDSFTDEGNEETEATSKDSVQAIRKKICISLVEAVASTNTWVITGGLNKGVDQLIGNEFKRRLANEDKNQQAVIGISNWGCLAEKTTFLNDAPDKNDYASDSNPTGLSLNQHHTHFLLVDDGTQKSGCECSLRQKVEINLTIKDAKKDLSGQLFYILIGGSVSALSFVKHALDNRIPVLIAEGTGGTADIILRELASKDDVVLDNLPEISKKLFHRLEELLTIASADQVRQVIANIKAKATLQLFFKIVQLLDKAIFYEDVQQFKDVVATVKGKTTNGLLGGIRDLLISKHTPSDNSNHSAANAELDTVERMRDVIGQMLVTNEIQPELARRTVDDLEPDVLNETLAKVKLVFNLLVEIRAHNQTDLLIKLKVSQKKRITCSIADALKKVSSNPSDVYMLVAAWDDEKFFRQLLQDNWMVDQHKTVHQTVLMELLNKKKNKYAELMIAHNSDSKWLTNSGGPLEDVFKKNKMCASLLEKINSIGLPINRDPEDKRTSLMGKMLFIWCTERGMFETAMLFWKRGQDCLAMILIAYRMSKIQKKKLVDKDGYEEMNRQKLFFSDHASKLLTACYADNKKNTYDLLVGNVKDFGASRITPLEIAGKANFSTFISLVPVQDLLNKIWIKDIENYNKYKYVPMLLSEACPLLAPVLFSFRDDDKKNNKTTLSQRFVPEYFLRIRSFIDTPFVKFTYGFISYIGYLILFSVVMLTDFRPRMTPKEIALTIWTSILLIEEVKQAIDQRSAYVNLYNFFDIGAIITYIVGFILRMIYHVDKSICPECLYVARIVLAFSLLIFFIRALQFLWIYKDIGPKIYMMRRLIADLIGFMMILTVFVSAYGVVSNVILYPNQPLNLDLLHDIFYDACWAVLQQFNREETAGSLCGNKNASAIPMKEYCKSTINDNIDYESCKANQCPANDWLVSVILALYALFTVVMLLNVLIAMFNATFTTISEKEKGVSKVQRYRLIREYSSNQMIPIPLCVLTYPYVFIKYLLCLIKNLFKYLNTHNGIKEQPKEKDKKQSGKMSNQSKSSPKAFEKDLKLAVKDWERHVVAKYYKQHIEKKGSNKPTK